MQIRALNSVPAFGRRLNRSERRELAEITQEAKQKLGTDITTAAVFDFSIPKSYHDTGIGSSFSGDAQKLASFLKALCGINSIQLQPQGQISNTIRSPYSGTSFSLGMHIIDLNKLLGKNYGNILKPEDFDKEPYLNRQINGHSADYDNIFSKRGQKAILKKAYDNFMLMPSSSALKQEFEDFKSSNEYWLEKDALYEAAAQVNGTSNSDKWTDCDKYLFASKEGNKERIEELKTVTDKQGRNIVDFEEFVQFIADKQQKESKKEFNKRGIDIFGDCQIGFSQKDIWAHRTAFSDTLEFGCDIGGGQHSCWSPAVDFNKLEGDAGELLYNKFDLFFKRYNGVRIDAAWQLISPLLVKPQQNENGQDVYDDKGNKLGYPADNQPWLGGRIIRDIVLEAAKNNGVEPKKIFLEMLGGKSYESLDAVKDLGMQLIHISRYASGGWGRVKFYEAQESGNSYQNMKPGDYIIGPGTHDNESLLAQFHADNKTERAKCLAEDLGLDFEKLRHDRNSWTDAVFGELFTTKNQFAALADILGEDRRINEPNVQKGNWIYRAESGYKKKYYENLSKGLGLNLPDALSKALKAQCGISQLTNKLDYYADVLREPENQSRKINSGI